MVRCPNCTAEISVHPDDAIITCSYCGTSFAPDGTRMKRHYALKVNYTEGESFDILKAYLVKVPGVPDDFAQVVSLKDVSMTYYPYWVFNVQGVVDYEGLDRKATFSGRERGNWYSHIHWRWVPEAGHEEQTRQIRIYAGPPARPEIRNYPIATRSRRYFNLEEAKEHTANILFSRIPEEAARQTAVKRARDYILDRISRETERIQNVRESFKVTDSAYIHVPIYHIRYTVGSKTYEAALDASNGRVIYAGIPRTTGFTLKAIIATLIWFGAAGAGAAIILLAPSLFYAGLGLAIIGAILGVETIVLSFRRIAAEAAR